MESVICFITFKYKLQKAELLLSPAAYQLPAYQGPASAIAAIYSE